MQTHLNGSVSVSSYIGCSADGTVLFPMLIATSLPQQGKLVRFDEVGVENVDPSPLVCHLAEGMVLV